MVSEILLALYEKSVNKRNIIRKTIIHCFENIIYDDHEFNGIMELLDFYSLIIRGFVVPLKQSNIDFFQKIIIPLHKHENLQNFFQSLKNCCYIYIMKDANLANQLLESLVRYMPFGKSTKEELFLGEIKEIFHNIEPNIIDKATFIKLCKRLVRSAKDSSFLVAVKSISILNIRSFLELIHKYQTEVLKLFFHALDNLFQSDVDDEYYDLLTLTEFNLSKIDQDLYETYLKRKDEDKNPTMVNNEEKWNILGQLAKERCNNFTSPVIPYNENTSLSNFNQTYQRFANKTSN